MYAEIAAILAPVFIAAGIGFAWARAGRPFDPGFVTQLVTAVGAPCLVASTLTRLPVDLSAMAEMAAVAAAAYAGFAAIGVVALRLLGLPLHCYLPALMFPNSGNMGLPLCLYAFGEAGLALAIVFFVISAALQFTVGAAIAAGAFDPRRLLRMPLIYAVAFSLAFLATGTLVPGWLANTLELVGGLTIPLMLLALGVSLAQLRVTALGRSLVLSLVRLMGGFAVAVALGWLLDLQQPARGVLIVQSAMPVAVFNYLFAQLYSRDPVGVAGAIVASTVLSFLSLPLLLWFVL